MRKPFAALFFAGAMSFALGGAVLADADPTVHQIYEAAESGHLDQAQQMIEQVLRDHPNSAKAHYVQSELFAREGKLGLARAELDLAEQIEPGLPKENPRSVAELKDQLGRTGGGLTGGGLTGGSLKRGPGLTDRGDRLTGASAGSATHFPWGMVLILALSVVVLWRLFRRRAANVQYPRSVGPTPAPGAYGPGAYPGPAGYPPGGIGIGGGGLGSTLASGLAGGLAAGAGIVAGEEIAHHFLDGERPNAPAASLTPASFTDDSEANNPNSDMGGADFGVDDPGSWNDDSGGGGGGGGGDDWS
jgi:hypothetical protein